MTLTGHDKTLLLDLARRSMEANVRQESFDPPADIQNRFHEKAGAFVTLHLNGRLRGCIGFIRPIASIKETIIELAGAAALHDSRFQPVSPAELNEIDIEISVLTIPEAVESPDDIVVGRHGVIIQLHGKQAVFLPQVAVEQKWDRDTLLSQLCRKAGLPACAWQEAEMEFEVFEAIVFGEKS